MFYFFTLERILLGAVDLGDFDVPGVVGDEAIDRVGGHVAEPRPDHGEQPDDILALGGIHRNIDWKGKE